MNTLEIKLKDDKDHGKLVQFFIDGKDFQDIVGDYEVKRYGEDKVAGKQTYDPIQILELKGDNYLTRPTKPGDFLDDEKGAALVLICTCHEWGCWNLLCTIEFQDDKVIWKDFWKHHRDWKYNFRFEFDKVLYLKEFEKIERAQY